MTEKDHNAALAAGETGPCFEAPREVREMPPIPKCWSDSGNCVNARACNATGECIEKPALQQLVDQAAGTEPRLTHAMIDGLRQYVEWCGGVHDDGCPEDDTCECSGKPINDAVNAICKLKEASGKR